jgi:hypothetical protein
MIDLDNQQFDRATGGRARRLPDIGGRASLQIGLE